jgi:hypothetical protein
VGTESHGSSKRKTAQNLSIFTFDSRVAEAKWFGQSGFLFDKPEKSGQLIVNIGI